MCSIWMASTATAAAAMAGGWDGMGQSDNGAPGGAAAEKSSRGATKH